MKWNWNKNVMQKNPQSLKVREVSPVGGTCPEPEWPLCSLVENAEFYCNWFLKKMIIDNFRKHFKVTWVTSQNDHKIHKYYWWIVTTALGGLSAVIINALLTFALCNMCTGVQRRTSTVSQWHWPVWHQPGPGGHLLVPSCTRVTRRVSTYYRTGLI